MRPLMYAFIAMLHIAAVALPIFLPFDYGMFVAILVSTIGWFPIVVQGGTGHGDIICYYTVANVSQIISAFIGFSAVFWVRSTICGEISGFEPFALCMAGMLILAYYHLMRNSLVMRQYQ